jgi:hypothetical protein
MITMEDAQSQVKSKKLFHSHLRRTALRLASRLNLSRVELQVLENLIEWITFKDLNPFQEIDQPIARYMLDLEIRDKAQVSHAFSRLEELNLVVNRRVGNVVNRSLSRLFVDEARHPGVVQSHNPKRKKAPKGCVPAQPSIVPPHNPGLCNRTTLPLDRKKDGRIDVNLDGRETSPSKVNGKVSPMAKDYATMYQDLYSGPKRYLSEKDFTKFNKYVQQVLNERGEQELGELIVFACSYINRQEPMDRKKISLYQFQGHVALWDGSKDKEDWLLRREKPKDIRESGKSITEAQNPN